jgi:hypothetical protein
MTASVAPTRRHGTGSDDAQAWCLIYESLALLRDLPGEVMAFAV